MFLLAEEFDDLGGEMQEEDGEDEYDGEHHDNEGVTEI